MYDLKTLQQKAWRYILLQQQANLFVMDDELADRFHCARISCNPTTNPYLINSTRRSNIHVGSHGVLGYVEERVFPCDEHIESLWQTVELWWQRQFSQKPEVKFPKHTETLRHLTSYPLMIPFRLWDIMGQGQQGRYLHETGGLQSQVDIGPFFVEGLMHDPSPTFPLFDQRYIVTSLIDTIGVIEGDIDKKVVDEGKNRVISKILKIEEILEQRLEFPSFHS